MFPASGTFGERGIRHLLYRLKAVRTGITFIFIRRHRKTSKNQSAVAITILKTTPFVQWAAGWYRQAVPLTNFPKEIYDFQISRMENGFFEKIKTKTKELRHNVSALYLAYKRKDVPVYAKIAIIMTVGYALSPIDLIPDFIPVLGYLDDMIIVPLLMILSLKLIPKKIMDECREEAKDIWKNGKPRKWYHGIPIILIWLSVVFMIFFKTPLLSR
jgi:uncharacterized membrane protein YkvA (DUF1232 family)